MATEIEHLPVTPGDAPGVRARIGLLLLATDYATESEMRHLWPGDDSSVAWFTSRVPNANPVTVDNLHAMGPELARATGTILPGERLSALAYGCTSATVLLGVAETKALLTRGRRDVPVTTPAIGALAAFRALRAERVAVLTPYPDPINTAIGDFLAGHGHPVARFGSFHLDTDAAMSGVRETDIARAAAHLDTPAADAVFISCTALRATRCITALEAELGKPVVASNQAMIWHALRLAEIRDARPGLGTLLTRDLDGDPAA